jgi:hypothetical protein
VASEGEAGRLLDLRSILAPAIIAWRQILGGSSLGVEEVAIGFAGFAEGAAAAIAPAYEGLAARGIAGGCAAGGLDVVA